MTEASQPRTRGWCPGALRPMQSGDGLLVRIKPSCGVLTLNQAEAIATLARDHGNGLIELTSRGNLQLRGVRSETLDALTASLDSLGLIDISAEAEAVRNVISSPLAGIDLAAFDTRDIVKSLEQRLTSDTSVQALSDKFGFLIDGGGALPLTDVEADIRFVWHNGTFAIGLAREQGCDRIGSCAASEVADAAATLAQAFLSAAPGVNRMRAASSEQRQHIAATFAATISPTAIASKEPQPLLPPETSSRRRPGPTQVSAGVRLAETRVTDPTRSFHVERADTGVGVGVSGDAGLSDGLPSEQAVPDRERPATNTVGVLGLHGITVLGFGLPYGGTTAAALFDLIVIARETGALELRLTPWRAILIHVPGDAAATRILARAAALGYIIDPADPRRAVAACPGAPACASGSTSVRDDADRFAAAAGPMLGDGATLHISGCAKGCARRQPAALTLVADAGRYGLVVNGTASGPARGRFTAAEAADLLARLASAMTQAGTTSGTCKTAAIEAALREIEAA